MCSPLLCRGQDKPEGGILPWTGAKAPTLVGCLADETHLCYGDRFFSWEELDPRCPFKVVAHQKGVVFCLYDPIDLSPVEGCETHKLFTPAEGANAYVLELGRNHDLSECYATEERFFANSYQSWR